MEPLSPSERAAQLLADERAGGVFFWAGVLIGNGGWFASMGRAWRRAGQRGDL